MFPDSKTDFSQIGESIGLSFLCMFILFWFLDFISRGRRQRMQDNSRMIQEGLKKLQEEIEKSEKLEAEQKELEKEKEVEETEGLKGEKLEVEVEQNGLEEEKELEEPEELVRGSQEELNIVNKEYKEALSDDKKSN